MNYLSKMVDTLICLHIKVKFKYIQIIDCFIFIRFDKN